MRYWFRFLFLASVLALGIFSILPSYSLADEAVTNDPALALQYLGVGGIIIPRCVGAGNACYSEVKTNPPAPYSDAHKKACFLCCVKRKCSVFPVVDGKPNPDGVLCGDICLGPPPQNKNAY